jgi:ribonuclease J
MNWKTQKDNFFFIPLSGANEIGMNLNLYHLDGQWLMVDFGIGFSDEWLPGVEITLPNIDFVLEHCKPLLGLVLTHAHEDHMGAIPYLWQELKCPIYATSFTQSVVTHKLGESGYRGKDPFHEIKPGGRLQLGPFDLEMVPLTHSIPEMQAIAIRTRLGTVFHTGDWKFDDGPTLGPVSAYDRMRELGDEGVLAVVCDSTNVFVEGHSASEIDVRQQLVEVVGRCKNRVGVTTFASNIARLGSIMEAARLNNRKVVLAGRSMFRMVEAAREVGYLTDMPEVISDVEAKKTAPGELLVLSTGCQGENRAATSKIARGEHPTIRFEAGDTFIFSSRDIPGNEVRVGWMQNHLIRRGIEVLTASMEDIHASGHPAQEELRKLYGLLRPKISIPVHGEARHLHKHVALAKEFGVPQSIEVQNGSVVLLGPGEARLVDQMEPGTLAMDGTSMIATTSPILKQRRRLRDDGVVMISCVLNGEGKLLAAPKLTTPGILDEQEDDEVLGILKDEIVDFIKMQGRKGKEQGLVEGIRNLVRRLLKREIGKQPLIEIHVFRV